MSGCNGAFLCLPTEEILGGQLADPGPASRLLGLSREGREIRGFRFGEGPLRVSLIGGCHADEPVGPALLESLAAYLASLPEAAPALRQASWWIVPHTNPDGRAANAGWTGRTVPCRDSRGEEDRAYDLAPFLDHAVRELPGDDLEFGFPRNAGDSGARPENRAVSEFLRPAAPLHLHGSFHGMAFASGPWFLLEPGWVGRTTGLRSALKRRVRQLGYPLFDVDRKGEKGFRRIEEGFSTRPDSDAMQEHFRTRGDEATARLFRPSSMEFVRSLGGDPLTLVSEMPLFLVPPPGDEGGDGPPLPVGTEGKQRFVLWARRLVRDVPRDEAGSRLRAQAAQHGIRGMPIRDQMRLQLALLNEGLTAVAREQSD